MNREEFDGRYELIAQVTEGIFESHHALHHSGVVVMAHFVSGSEGLKAAVQAAAEGLRADEADHHVLESHRIDDQLVVVTRFLKDFESLEGWLASRGYPLGAVGADSTRADSADAGPEAGSARGAGPGDFTRMFMAGQGLPDRPEPDDAGSLPPASRQPSGETPPAAPPPPPPPSAPPASEAEASQPGEFTQMFRAVPPKSEPPSSPSPGVGGPQHPDRREAAAAGSDSGRGSSPTGSASPGADQEAGDGPGEFTQMFRALGSEPPQSEPPGGSGGTPTESPPPTSTGPMSPTASDHSSPAHPREHTDDPRGTHPPSTPADRFAPPPKEETGEFTRFFRPGQGAGPPDPSQEPSLDWSDAPIAGRSREPEPPSAPPQQTDDWAKALRTDRPSTAPGSPSTPTPPVEETPRDHGEFTQIFGAETPPLGGSTSGATSKASPSSEGKGAPPSKQSSSSGGGFKAPKIPKARIPDAEALIRGGRMRRGKPPRFRPPRGRRLARMGAGAALGAAQAALSGSGDAGAAPEDGAEQPAGGLSSSTFRIVLAVIVVVTVALVAFFALWEFGGAPADEAPVTDSVVAAPAGPEG